MSGARRNPILRGFPLLLIAASPVSHAIVTNCTLGNAASCPSDQTCMNLEPGPVCLRTPSTAPLQLTLPFDSRTEVVCTHASGVGSHSWPNAFYALDLATPYEKSASVVRAAAPGKAFVFLAKDGTPCAQPEGTPAKAAWDRCGDGWGNHIKILHSDGVYFTLYAHLEKILIKTGEEVKTGQPIGIEGWTGSAGHRHLHWSVQRLPGNTQQDREANLLTWSGNSVPFWFTASVAGKKKKFDSSTLSCAHANIGQAPSEKQPRFSGVDQ